jgi:ligand-binding sensor domain-containing protein
MVICPLFGHATFDPKKLYLKNIDLDNGLSQIVVTDITEDNKGFIWVGTFDGLNRFDGSSIKVFSHKPGDSTSLPSSAINRVYSDYNQHLYLYTRVGFSVFDCQTQKIIRPEIFNRFKPQWVTRNSSNELWVYTKSRQLVLINVKDFSLIKEGPKLDDDYVFSDMFDMCKIRNNIYLFADNGTVVRYDIALNDYFIYYSPNPEEFKLNSIGLDKNQNIFIASAWMDFLYFNTVYNRFENPEFVRENSKLVGINKVVFDSNRNVLYLTTYGQGLFVYDYATLQMTQYKRGDERINLSGNYLSTIFSTSNGMIYIGYDGEGFDVIDPNVKQFVPIIKNDIDESKTIRFVRKIVEDLDGNILMGTAGNGLVKYNPKVETFDFFPIVNKLSQSNNFVIEMIRHDKELWLGFNGEGLGIADLKTLKISKRIGVGATEMLLSDGTIWSMLDTKDGHIWIGTRGNGINVLNIQTGKIRKITATDFPAFNANGIRTMYLRKNNKVIVGTEVGLFEVDRTTLNISKIKQLEYLKTGNTELSIKCIYEDSKGMIWIGTNGDGLYMLDANYKLLKSFNTENFLSNNVIYSILPQNDTTVWMSSNAGLTKLYWSPNQKIENAKFKSIHFNEINGLQSNEFNTGAYAMLSGGRMAFGGLNGLNIFNPNEIKTTFYSPKVYISELKIFENRYKSDTSIIYLKSVKLRHFENSLSFGFNTLGFTLPEKTKFQYRLLGYDKNWINANNRNYVSYTNLNSGDYEFQVRASVNGSEWEAAYTSLKISIATPFYRTWWFISIVALSLLQIAYLIYRFRMKQILEKETIRIQYNKDLAEVEMKALRAQINPHFLFNSLNSINNFILKNDTEKASKYLIKFSQLVRNILNNSSSSYVSLQEELQTIELYMLIEGMRFNNQFSYSIEIEDDINTSVIKMPSLLLQPYVENAIWHGLLHKEGEKKIWIKIKRDTAQSISIHIEDNGVGRVAAKAMQQRPKDHKSFGMQIGESRLKLMNNGQETIAKVEVVDMYTNTNEPKGTQIKIIIPSNLYVDDFKILN